MVPKYVMNVASDEFYSRFSQAMSEGGYNLNKLELHKNTAKTEGYLRPRLPEFVDRLDRANITTQIVSDSLSQALKKELEGVSLWRPKIMNITATDMVFYDDGRMKEFGKTVHMWNKSQASPPRAKRYALVLGDKMQDRWMVPYDAGVDRFDTISVAFLNNQPEDSVGDGWDILIMENSEGMDIPLMILDYLGVN